MVEPSQVQVRAIWRQLAQRNEWRLVVDEAQFFAQVDAELRQLSSATPTETDIRRAIRRAYSALLYEGIAARDNQAARELWRAFIRIALRDGSTPEEADDWAQETVTRLIEKQASIRSPQNLLAWAMMLFRTVRRDLKRPMSHETQLKREDSDRLEETADPADIAAEVERQVLGEELIPLLRAKLTNDLERLVILRIVFMGDHPRDVARDLGLPLPRTRLAKSRALQRLRDDPQFMRLIESLAEARRSIAITGAHDDKS